MAYILDRVVEAIWGIKGILWCTALVLAVCGLVTAELYAYGIGLFLGISGFIVCLIIGVTSFIVTVNKNRWK